MAFGRASSLETCYVNIELRGLCQKSLLGGLGGLIGWVLLTVFVWTPKGSGVIVPAMLTGALIGLAIGVCSGAWEGLFRDRNLERLKRGVRIGAITGLIGGAFGLLIGEFMFQLIGGGLFTRAIGWSVFGAAVGTNEGLAKLMPQKVSYGAFGGLLGGLLGGSMYESLANVFQWLGFGRDVAIAVGGSVGLVLLGMCIGCLIGLVEDILRPAWLMFMSGKLEGQTRTLDPKKRATTIGRAELADICLLGDPSVSGRHAEVTCNTGDYSIKSIDGEVTVNRNGTTQRLSGDFTLESGDLIQIGSVRAQFNIGGD